MTLYMNKHMQASPGKSSVSQRRGSLRCYAGLDPGAERALVGEDFGARDPFAGEIESNFGEKVLGNSDTEHIIRCVDYYEDDEHM